MRNNSNLLGFSGLTANVMRSASEQNQQRSGRCHNFTRMSMWISCIESRRRMHRHISRSNRNVSRKLDEVAISHADIFSTDNVGDDCPVFDGLFEYCSISAGGSMG